MKFLTTCILLALSTCCLAQETSYRHIVSVGYSNLSHAPGSGFLVGYDYMFGYNRAGFWNAGAELGGTGLFKDNYHEFSFRTSAGYNLGKQKHFLRLGIGGAYYNGYYTCACGVPEDAWTESYYSGPLIGYRFIGTKTFQLGASAGVYMSIGTNTRNFYPVTGSIGWSLGKR